MHSSELAEQTPDCKQNQRAEKHICPQVLPAWLVATD